MITDEELDKLADDFKEWRRTRERRSEAFVVGSEGMNAPEGFVPYEMGTKFGTLTLPDRKCALCIANWSFFSCTMCCFTQTLEQDAKPIVDKMNDELNRGKRNE